MISTSLYESKSNKDNPVTANTRRAVADKPESLLTIARKLELCYLKDKSVEEFYGLFEAYLNEIKKHNLKIADHYRKRLNQVVHQLYGQSTDTAKTQIEDAIFKILDWDNLTLNLKKVQIERYIHEGQVDRIDLIIKKNDPELQFFWTREFPYIAVKHNQMKVLDLAFGLLEGLSPKKLDAIKTRLLQESICYHYDELSIDLIENKKTKISLQTLRHTEKYASEEIKKYLKSNRMNYRIERVKIADDSNETNSKTVSDHAINTTTEVVETPISPGLIRAVEVDKIISNGSTKEIQDIFESNETDTIEYLNKYMVQIALKANRSDMLKLAFEHLYKDGARLSKYIWKKLAQASKCSSSENQITCFLNTGCVKNVCRQIFYRTIENHSENVAEQLFWLAYKAKIKSPSWEAIYQLARDRNYCRIMKLIDENIFFRSTVGAEHLEAQSDIFDAELDFDAIIKMLDNRVDLDNFLNAFDECVEKNNFSENTVAQELKLTPQDDWLFDSNTFLNQFDHTSLTSTVVDVDENENQSRLNNRHG